MLIILLTLASLASAADEVWVNSYTREDGTFVPGHYRTAANETKCDNWTTVPNVNPYTGEPGTRAVCNPVQQIQYQNTTIPRYNNSSASGGGVSLGAGGGLSPAAVAGIAVGTVAVAGIVTAAVIAHDIKEKREMERTLEATPEGYIALRVKNGKELAKFPNTFKNRYLTDRIGKDVLRIFEYNDLEDFDKARFKLAWEEIESHFYSEPEIKRRAHEVLVALVELHKTGKM